MTTRRLAPHATQMSRGSPRAEDANGIKSILLQPDTVQFASFFETFTGCDAGLHCVLRHRLAKPLPSTQDRGDDLSRHGLLQRAGRRRPTGGRDQPYALGDGLLARCWRRRPPAPSRRGASAASWLWIASPCLCGLQPATSLDVADLLAPCVPGRRARTGRLASKREE